MSDEKEKEKEEEVEVVVEVDEKKGIKAIAWAIAISTSIVTPNTACTGRMAGVGSFLTGQSAMRQ